jgi:hypothetical protein
MIITPQSIFVSLNISQLPLECGMSPRCGMTLLHNYRNITIEVCEREAELNHAFDLQHPGCYQLSPRDLFKLFNINIISTISWSGNFPLIRNFIRFYQLLEIRIIIEQRRHILCHVCIINATLWSCIFGRISISRRIFV